ncbi:helix-turn-helix transcriptional regulator [Myroides odoratimimus]|uniref:helix-turn-helix transcriptional regulator n=1 Tax=Myroides odoratimimus TaxID=76832 RepID=UPI00046A0AC4|nr:AraC family transcriptional regulator [Myroides odoratimimus]
MEMLLQTEKEIDQYKDSIYIMREQLEHRFPPHKHNKSQILLVSGGIAYLKTKEREYYIPAQHYVWIPKGMIHNVKSNTTDVVILNIYFYEENTDVEHRFMERLGIYPVSNLMYEMLIYARQWKGIILPDTWAYEFLSTMKHYIMQHPGKSFSIQLPTTEEPKMLLITEYMQKNLGEALTLNGMAEVFGYSVRTLTRLFKTHLDISFLQYLKMVRMIKAMELLMSTDKNVSEVAFDVGYSSIAAFSNTFQQLFNVRPSDFQISMHNIK